MPIHPKKYAHGACFIVFCWARYGQFHLHCHWVDHTFAPDPVKQSERYGWLNHMNHQEQRIYLQQNKAQEHLVHINSLWTSDTLWWYRSWSTLAQVVTCRLMAPSHYLNLWSLLMRFCGHMRAISWSVLKLLFCIMILKIIHLNVLPHLLWANGLNRACCRKSTIHQVLVLS